MAAIAGLFLIRLLLLAITPAVMIPFNSHSRFLKVLGLISLIRSMLITSSGTKRNRGIHKCDIH